jgi:hypothetical protein
MQFEVKLCITINLTTSGTAEVLEIKEVLIAPVTPPEGIHFSYIWKDMDARYGIITLGAKHAINLSMLKGTELRVKWNGREFAAKSHKSIKGRIDGLTALIRQNPSHFKAGTTTEMHWDPSANTLEIK